MSEAKTYAGGCHCGQVRYEVTAEIKQAMQCNCSICSKRGWMLTFVPEQQFKAISGVDAVTDYQFGKKHIHHVFCPTCGVSSFAKGTHPSGGAMYAVNLRCLEGLELASLPVQHVNGKDA